MPILTVNLEEGEQHVSFLPGHSLRHILDATDFRVRAGCRGTGACGLCLVQVEKGRVPEPTAHERVFLDEEEISRGIRLACQVVPEEDLQVLVLAPAPRSSWRSITGLEQGVAKRYRAFPRGDLPAKVRSPYGAAVDLGTTHIRISLYDLAGGDQVAGLYGLNPQVDYGSDVMTRLLAASESQGQARAISQQALTAIGRGLWDIALREGVDLGSVVRLVLVGNTAMLALLAERNYHLLLQPACWMKPIDCLPRDAGAWAAGWKIHERARVEVIPPLAGFVGSDLVAGVFYTRLREKGAGSLFIDFGTNSEIALWDGRLLWVTSAAGGPAFEGSGISCGMPAGPGAVYKVDLQDGALDFSVISGSKPRGFCGPGLVDLVANLLRQGKLNSLGQFAPTVPGEGFPLPVGERGLALTKKDVDLFQRAKAAIGVGIKTLLDRSGTESRDLQRICVGGAFGSFLDVANAQGLGLLPGIQPERVELWGNTALGGCQEALFYPAAVQQMKRLMSQARFIDLSRCPDFYDNFLENLYLQPMKGNEKG